MKDLQIKKLYYSISEVSKMLGLEQYVLRYWETEFEQLRPQKNRAGNRVYTEKDIETIKLIRKLTREDRYTIEGARQVMKSLGYEGGAPVGDLNLKEAEQELEPVEIPEERNLDADLRAIRSSLVDLLKRFEIDSE